MSWLNGEALENLINKYGDEETKKAFLGVFAMDTLPKRITKLPILLIVNTHMVNLPGEHWMAIYISSTRFGEVFDSLSSPVNIHLQRWLNTFTRRWMKSNTMIQNPLSSTCGAFVLFYVLTRLKSKSLKSCLKFFSRNWYKNDHLILNFVKDLKK